MFQNTTIPRTLNKIGVTRAPVNQAPVKSGLNIISDDYQPGPTVIVTNSNEYLSALKTSDPLLHNIKCTKSFIHNPI